MAIRPILIRLSLFVLLVIPKASFGIFNFGSFANYPGQIQIDDRGETNDIFDIKPFAALNGIFNFWGSFFFQPEIGALFPSKGQGDSTRNVVFQNLNFGYRISGPLALKFGHGLFLTTIKSEPGEIVLNNGSGTSTFYRPEGKSTAYNSTLNLGLEYLATNTMSLRFDSYTFQLLDKNARKFSFSFSLSYYFDSGGGRSSIN